VWLQQFYQEGGRLLVREEADSPACEALIRSPYDTDARLCAKREMVWTGYKVHLTETCDEDTPHLITQVETTTSTMPDVSATPIIQARLAKAGRMPSEHLVDEGYTQAGHLVNSQVKYGTTLLGPVARDGSRQAVAAEGFDVTAFTVDYGGLGESMCHLSRRQEFGGVPSGEERAGCLVLPR
jgi:transposase